jgi:hypothetical protein
LSATRRHGDLNGDTLGRLEESHGPIPHIDGGYSDVPARPAVDGQAPPHGLNLSVLRNRVGRGEGALAKFDADRDVLPGAPPQPKALLEILKIGGRWAIPKRTNGGRSND